MSAYCQSNEPCDCRDVFEAVAEATLQQLAFVPDEEDLDDLLEVDRRLSAFIWLWAPIGSSMC